MFRLLYLLIFVFVESESAKILGVFPTPSVSHQVVFRPLMLELAKRGHEVTVITTDPAFPKGQTPANFTEIDVHDISYDMIEIFFNENNNVEDPILTMKLFFEIAVKIVETQLRSLEIQEHLRNNKKYDLLIIESFFRPALIYSHIYDAPVIEICSFTGMVGTYDGTGAPTHPLYYPLTVARRIYNLTFWEKIMRVYINYGIDRIYNKNIAVENKVFRQIYGPDVPSIEDLKRNVHMIFLNVHPIWDFNRPVPPNIQFIGGLHQTPQKELPQDLKSYLDASKNGIIYISFGTNVKPIMIPPHILKMFTDVLSKLPYDVLWKWDDDDLPGRPKNVRISKWLPQSDLLRHPNVKLFIMQGGLQSTDEAITAGIPLVGLPFFGDQWFNVEQYVHLRIGKGLLIETMSEEILMDSIKSVIEDKSYRENIVQLRNKIHDQPQTSLERAVWWTEHVLRHGGGTHLRASAAHVDWTEYYELNLVLMCLSVVVVAVVVLVLSLYFIISKFTNSSRKKVKKN